MTQLSPVKTSQFKMLPGSANECWLCFDLESDGLYDNVTVIHCIVIYDIQTKQTHKYGPTDVTAAINHLASADVLIGQSILFYDIPVLQKLFPDTTKFRGRIIDTLICTQLIWPKEVLYDFDTEQYPEVPKDLKGRAGLKAWGYRLSNYKIEFKDFSEYSEEMLAYCEQDVRVTLQLFQFIQKQNYAESALKLEHDFALAINKQVRAGFPFDVDACLDLVDVLRAKKDELHAKVMEVFPPIKQESVFMPKVNNKSRGYIKGKPFNKVTYHQFNPGSRPQIVSRLKNKYGWVPEELTDKGNPILDDEVLSALDYPEAKVLGEYLTIKKRLGQIADGEKAWLKYVNNQDSCMHGEVVTNGCITGRCAHRNPNMGQVPASYSPYGKECRSLFHAPDGWDLLGVDAKALELRCLGGYLALWDDGEYANLVTDESVDIHVYNQERFGVATRDIAKRLIYCVPSDKTQLLTKDGWKSYGEFKVGDLVLTYNAEKEIKEWKPILYIVEEHEDDVWQMSHNHSFVVEATKEHRWFVKKRKRNYNVSCGWNTGTHYMIPKVETTDEINSESNIIVNAPFVEDDHEGIEIDWSWRKYGTDWTKKILQMNSKQRKAWLSGFMVADGFQSTKPNQKVKWHWSQLRNEHYEAALMATYLEFPGVVHVCKPKANPSGTTQMSVSIANKGHVTGQKLQKVHIGRKKVFCISTENESFVMRQGDCITITGNCMLYGGGAEKAGTIVDPNEKNPVKLKLLGRNAINGFMDGVPALKQLKQKLANTVQERGYLRGLDGRALYCRSDFKALNVLLQGAGAMIMKQVIINTHNNLEAKGLVHGYDWVQHAMIHDEIQLSCPKKHTALVKEQALLAFPQAQQFFAFRCEIEGDAKVGWSWDQTH